MSESVQPAPAPETNADELEARVHEGLMLLAAEHEAPASLRQRVLDRVLDAQRAPEHTLTVHADEGQWKTVLPGVHMKNLHADRSGRSFLLRLDPGAVLPAHAHDGDEECLVLSGELYLGDFRVGTGGYHLAKSGSAHGDIHAPGGALVFLRSAVSTHYDMRR